MSENSFKAILNRMKNRIQIQADKREGTWTADNLQAVSNEIARIYSEDVENILPQAFVETANGKNLDAACSDYGFARREATCAEVMLEVSGDPGKYNDMKVYVGEIIFLVDPFMILSADKTVSVRAVCSVAGDLGNVAAGSITETDNSRIVRVSNPEAAEGGFNRESDDRLRERMLEHIRTPAVSGNIAHYIQWAKEVSGVEKVRVFDLARGPGTVDVVLIADNNQQAEDGLIEEVWKYIETKRPIGADVMVSSAEAVQVRINATVILQEDYTFTQIDEEYGKILSEYFQKISFTKMNVISKVRMEAMLFDCEGVLDVLYCTVNDKTESLVLQPRQFPVAVMPELIQPAGG